MPRFSANLTLLWPEVEQYDRFPAAAAAGFRRVEILFLYPLDRAWVRRLLDEHGLELVLFDPEPGDWGAGERGLLALPGREDEFRRNLEAAIDTAQQLNVPRLNALAGLLPDGVSRAQAEATAASNLRAAAPLMEAAGLTLLVESINSVDWPGYVVDTIEVAARLVQEAASPAVRLQLDQYHVGMMGGDARQALARYAPLVEHVQIADIPGRHQPGTGQQPIAAFLDDLDRLGYAGSVGLEYRPEGPTEDALAWLSRDRRG